MGVGLPESVAGLLVGPCYLIDYLIIKSGHGVGPSTSPSRERDLIFFVPDAALLHAHKCPALSKFSARIRITAHPFIENSVRRNTLDSPVGWC